MRCYSKLFLKDAKENLGEALEYAVYGTGISGQEFLDMFLVSGLADSFSGGNVRLVTGVSGKELADMVFEKCIPDYTPVNYDFRYDYPCPYWIGWTYTHFQWKSQRSFSDIINRIPYSSMDNLYGVLHEADINKSLDVMEGFFGDATNLAKMRENAGLSQNGLAKASGVSLRSIQMYEQEHNDIKKAQLNRLVAIAQALNCRVEDIV